MNSSVSSLMSSFTMVTETDLKITPGSKVTLSDTGTKSSSAEKNNSKQNAHICAEKYFKDWKLGTPATLSIHETLCILDKVSKKFFGIIIDVAGD